MIADDEAIIREGLHTMVRGLDCPIEEIRVAENGEKALAVIRDFHPEIALVDIDMPIIDGLTLISLIKKELPECKIIIISGYDRFDYAQRAIALGVSEYLLKPIGKPELYHALLRAMESYQDRMYELGLMHHEKPLAVTGCDIPHQALNYINEHFIDNTLTLTALSNRFHLTRTHLSKVLTQLTGKSFSVYLNDLRIEYAKRLLSEKEDVMIYEVAGMSGYSSQHYFCRVFKEYTGMSPTEYRERFKTLGNLSQK